MMLNRHKGFTLIEMAVVLVIMGLTLSGILGISSAQIKSARIASTKQKQEAIKLALINFIARNNRMPCPAIGSLAKGAAGYGTEAPDVGVCTGTNVSSSVSTGIVPWISLGLSDENASDGFYNRFTYQVTLSATNRTLETIAGLKGAISTHSVTPVIMSPPATGNQTNDCTPAGHTYNPCSAVAIIISHGINGGGAYSEDGNRKALPIGDDELENTNNNSKFVIKDYSDNVNNPFDDIVLPLSVTDLLTPLTAHGSIEDYRALMNDDVANIKSAIIANAVANRDNTPGNYSYPIFDTLPALPASTAYDPWGSLYLYARNNAAANIDSATNGALTAFTITSYGADGVAGGGDDIVNVITVNQLQDAFSKAGW